MILIGCAIGGMVVVVATIAAFGHPRGGPSLSLATFFLGGGLIASVITAVMSRELACWPDRVKTAEQINGEVVTNTMIVLLPSLAVGALALWKWMKKD